MTGLEHRDTWQADVIDLLTIIAESNFPALQESIGARLGSVAQTAKANITSRIQWAAYEAMDGDHSQSEIANQAGMDRSNLSKWVKKLQDAKLASQGPSGPCAVLTKNEQRALRGYL